jgi:uncharacterized membrane protein
MKAHYNQLAGQSVARLEALSDGIFAFAMTLLVLQLRVPASDAVHSEHDLWLALVALAPRLLTYLMSFLTLGIFWVGQQTQLSRLARSDRDLTWMHIGFLLWVAITPFSTALLAEFITYRIALLAYWFNLLLLGVMLLVSLRYAARAGLLTEDTTPHELRAYERRVVIAQALYAFGALLCLVNTYVSIAFIVLVQLNYAIAPRIHPLYRL